MRHFLICLTALMLALPAWAASHTFDTAAAADNAVCESTTVSSYPPPFMQCDVGAGLGVDKDAVLGFFYIQNAFVRWTDSGNLLVGSLITAASLEVCVEANSLISTDTRDLSCEWYANWSSLGVADYTTGDTAGTALTVALSSLNDTYAGDVCVVNVLPLTNPDANIQKGSTTALRCAVTGAQPTGGNDVTLFGPLSGLSRAPRLNVTYDLPTPTDTPTGTLPATATVTETPTQTETSTPTAVQTATPTPWCNQLPFPACNNGVGTPGAADTPIANASCNGGTGLCSGVTPPPVTPSVSPTLGMIFELIAATATTGPSGTPTETPTTTPTGDTPTPTVTPTVTLTPTGATSTPTPTLGMILELIAPKNTPRHCQTITPTGTPHTPTPTPTVPSCCGDCMQTGTVTNQDVQTCTEISLDALPLSVCPNCDCDSTGTVTVDDLLEIAHNRDFGCPLGSPTPTVTRTPTSGPTPTSTPHGITCCTCPGLCGDCDGDGRITSAEVALATAAQHDWWLCPAADCDQSGAVTIPDLNQVQANFENQTTVSPSSCSAPVGQFCVLPCLPVLDASCQVLTPTPTRTP